MGTNARPVRQESNIFATFMATTSDVDGWTLHGPKSFYPSASLPALLVNRLPTGGTIFVKRTRRT